MKGAIILGRDNHNNKTGGNNTNSLPQTPKNQKIKPGNMQEEIAKEFAELRKAKKKKKL
ncbi:YfhD family protein [Sporosarcina sp. SAFN-015]|uniref:YfhD family protein n=1 Tax=Sporosarcina sp. SAFN-015 TaxID=3387274 RepID=UPI003F80A248